MISNLGNSASENIENVSHAIDLEKDHSIFTLYSSGHNENFLTIENKKAKLDKDGKIDFDDEVVIENIYISNLVKDKLIEIQKTPVNEENE